MSHVETHDSNSLKAQRDDVDDVMGYEGKQKVLQQWKGSRVKMAVMYSLWPEEINVFHVVIFLLFINPFNLSIIQGGTGEDVGWTQQYNISLLDR